jgi:phosphate starvation-inducible PhoH-like protein
MKQETEPMAAIADVTEKLDFPMQVQRELFGSQDSNIRKIEEDLHVSVTLRDGTVNVTGDPANVGAAVTILRQLSHFAEHGSDIDSQRVNYALDIRDEKPGDRALLTMDADCICHTAAGRPVKPKTLGQKQYIDAIRKNMITFANGPAGTGKTYLAMAMAISAFQSNEVQRIILTRPAIEAGEKLGFLPGDLQQKIDPYLRPLYDALFQIMGAENFQRNQEKGLIEVAPLAYMRGRTLDNAYIILDEAQNTTPEQMKMFLTRLGFGSKAIVTGDTTQKDLDPSSFSGLEIAQRILSDVEGICFITLTSKDVVRHPLVQRIVKAYEEYDKKQAGRKQVHEAEKHERPHYGHYRRQA